MAGTSNVTTSIKTGPVGKIDIRPIQEKQQAGVDRFKERSAKAAAQTQKLSEMRGAWQKALETKDLDTLKILNADFQSATRASAQNTKDLSSMMFALLDGYKEIGISIKAAEDFTTSEQSIMSSAQALVVQARGSLVQAQAKQWNIFGMRDKAIAIAQSSIETAEGAVKTAKQQAELMRRDRLNTMDMKQSMQLQQAITQELTAVAQERIAEIESNLTSVQQNVTDTMDGIKTDTLEMEGLDEKLAQANGEIRTLNDELVSYIENSSEWQDCRDRVLKKTRERDNTEAQRNAAFMRTQEGQRFIEFNRMEEQGQVQLLAQHTNWISLLQMGTKQRDILYEVHLGLVRGAADQQAMSMIDEVATQTDEHMVGDAAMKTQAMREATLRRLEGLPDQVRRLRAITSTENKNQVEFERKFAAQIEEFHANFGSTAGYDDRDSVRGKENAA